MAGIVIIESDRLMSRLLEDCLAQAGYAVREGRLDDAAPQPAALVIVDLYMPREHGARRVRSVNALYPGTPVIAMSCQFSPGISEGGAIARTLGVDKVIAKPFRREALLDAVRTLIGHPAA